LRSRIGSPPPPAGGEMRATEGQTLGGGSHPAMSRLSRRDAHAALALVALAAMAAPALAAPEVRAVARALPALAVFRNTHATSAAWLVKQIGLGRTGERDKTLIATAWVYIRQCGDCSDPDSITWPIGEGIAAMARERGAPVSVREACTRPAKAEGAVQFSDVKAAIGAGRPVLVTFCYDPRAARSTSAAIKRNSNAVTVAVFGYVVSGGRKFIIARDGLAKHEGAAAKNLAGPEDAGLKGNGVWGEAGTKLYKWEGLQTNTVVTFVTRAAPGAAR